MKKNRLNEKLLEKISLKTKYDIKYLREQVSKKANKLGITSEAALILWAKKLGIGTVSFQRLLQPHIQGEIRNTLSLIANHHLKEDNAKKNEKAVIGVKNTSGLKIEDLILDVELQDRCKDLLKAKRNFDRVFREATTILDNRIKKLAGLTRMKPLDAIGKAVNPDPTKAILKISDENFEQEGFFNICKGLILLFRDRTHHEISDKFSREDALKFCGFVDIILATLNKAKKSNIT